ncbi:PWWP domain-containing DNA repair factor 3B isoform X2 [Betta splendens]|uniref:PWWP domain-containing DNA repair factor 3B isoform X2 n=1 Tax=Betta splendens TaxID=158456 RepID=A0A9W2XP10_BETSP|nr:PWWP domain-containing DNA repair factor 3B isoform X2 [Betta splendens]
MKGGGKPKPKTAQRKKKSSKTLSSLSTEVSDVVPCNDIAAVSQTTPSSLPSTPTRWKQEAQLTSTPKHGSSTAAASPCGAKQESESKCCQSKSQGKRKRAHNPQPRQLRTRAMKEQVDVCSETNNPPVKPRRGRRRKVDTASLQRDPGIQSSKRSRPKFELKEQDDSWLSSDLSIELSHCEEPLPIMSFKEDEDSEHDDDDDELPSFSMQMDKEALCIADGHFVWYKCRNYPFWPALVKKVNHKLKKASIIFIDDPMINKKGHRVTLKILKPFDCEEHDELVCKAKERYHAAINWSLELINDYRIRIACGSFSGSFIEYFAHDMSYPVRRTYPKAASEQLSIASDTVFEELSDDHTEDSFNEQQTGASSLKRLLPDRTQAAHNRANERLVHFIVKQRMVDDHLLAVIRGQQQSRWLRSFLSAKRRREVNIYLEDDHQLDQVYWYLSELYTNAIATATGLAVDKSVDSVPFVLDVLLPEAITYAIAGVDNVSIEKAEEKYLRGRCLSNREKEEIDLMIDRLIINKSKHITA